jgi:hypothetical protein
MSSFIEGQGCILPYPQGVVNGESNDMRFIIDPSDQKKPSKHS